ncbi:MAG TPA: response regulator transcription factor [Patescibacteria group bacterium]|nr:response regulator transcription factor [Patescibacteria group bacterium]
MTASKYYIPRIFITDDSQIFITSVQKILSERNRYSVCGTSLSGDEALLKIKETHPDIAIIDIQMPDTSGTEVIAQIRRMNFPLKILAVSVCEEGETIARALKAGADGYLSKLRGIEQLIYVIEKLLDGESYFTDVAIILSNQNTTTLRN